MAHASSGHSVVHARLARLSGPQAPRPAGQQASRAPRCGEPRGGHPCLGYQGSGDSRECLEPGQFAMQAALCAAGCSWHMQLVQAPAQPRRPPALGVGALAGKVKAACTCHSFARRPQDGGMTWAGVRREVRTVQSTHGVPPDSTGSLASCHWKCAGASAQARVVLHARLGSGGHCALPHLGCQTCSTA